MYEPHVYLSPNMYSYFLAHIFSLHAFILLFHQNTTYTKNLSCPTRIICFLYFFITMIIFWKSIHLGFESHQKWTFSAGLGMARNRDRLSWNRVLNSQCCTLLYLYPGPKVSGLLAFFFSFFLAKFAVWVRCPSVTVRISTAPESWNHFY